MTSENSVTIIRPIRGWLGLNVKELWRFRELLYIFVWRDLKVRYKQTYLGVLWAIFQPLVTMIIFSFFFGRLAKIPSDNVPYPVFVFAGLLFWNYFASALTTASNTLVDNENMIKKIYFPRLLLPWSAAVTPLVDLAISSLVLLGLMLWYGFTPSLVGLVVMPLLMIISLTTVVGLGTLLASINIRYRDIRYILPFFIQLLLFLTPVIYPSSLISENYRWILTLNPMTGVIDTARAALLRTQPFPTTELAVAIGVALFLFLVGTLVYRRTERIFADIA